MRKCSESLATCISYSSGTTLIMSDAPVQSTRAGGGSDIPAAQRRNEVKILDIYEGVASVRVNASGWIDYMHMVRWNGQWKIINVVWENEPGRRN